MGLTIDQMNLGPLARQGAHALLAEFGPDVIRFTRGYADLKGQARAMAGNVARNKEWIKQTYTRTDRPSYVIACALQEEVYRRAEVKDRAEIEQYLYAALQSIPNAEAISFHCLVDVQGQPASEAFDLLPIEDAHGMPTAEGYRVIASIRRLPGLDAFLHREGGLRIWHAQFMAKTPISKEV